MEVYLTEPDENPHVHAYTWYGGLGYGECSVIPPVTLKFGPPYPATIEFRLVSYGLNLTTNTFDEETGKFLHKAANITLFGLDKKYLTGWLGPGKPEWLEAAPQ